MKKVLHANSSIPYIQAHDKAHFEKMYPGIDMENKYVSAISSIKRVQCLWNIKLDEKSGSTYNSVIEYKISFQERSNERHYSICSHDADIPTIAEAHGKGSGVFRDTYIEYSKAFTAKSDPDGNYFFPVKGQPETLNDYDLFKVLYESLDFEGFFDALISDKSFIVDYFMAEEALISHTCSWL